MYYNNPMQIFTGLNENKNLAIALGFFDGVHLGHQKVIKSAVNFANKNGKSYASKDRTFVEGTPAGRI